MATKSCDNVTCFIDNLGDHSVHRIVLARGSYVLPTQLVGALSITRRMTIEAAVNHSVVLDAQAVSVGPRRVLLIDAGSSIVQLTGLNITGGYRNLGGGILIQSGMVRIDNCNIYSNQAPVMGGGVAVVVHRRRREHVG